ncbi:MAG: hypothetical protein AB1758_32290 [Candidatus Eremiobacterota bacterium]
MTRVGLSAGDSARGRSLRAVLNSEVFPPPLREGLSGDAPLTPEELDGWAEAAEAADRARAAVGLLLAYPRFALLVLAILWSLVFLILFPTESASLPR